MNPVAPLAFLLTLATLASSASANVGRVISLRGEATLTRAADGGYARIDLERGMRVQEGDQLRTRRNSSLRIVFDDRSLLNIGENASVVVQSYKVQNGVKKRDVGIKVWAGRAWARVTKWFGGGQNSYEIRTPNAVAGVRGTEFSIDVAADGATQVTVYEGVVDVGLEDGDSVTTLLEGERSRVDAEGNAVKETVAAQDLAQDRRQSQQVSAPDTPAPPPADDAGQPPTGRDETLEDPALEENAAPPLDLDPASGESRVRGRVEFRE
ncbi:MAG: FecR family protein [Myxococcota bacterium]